jgi:hypothetical protein
MMLGRVYLAARFSRREELCRYRDELESNGIGVTSRWLDGNLRTMRDGSYLGDHGVALVESELINDESAAMRGYLANEDIYDIQAADALIAFTEPSDSPYRRGGRHVEMGIALAWELPIIIIGYRENLFCWLPQVQFAATWNDAKGIIIG